MATDDYRQDQTSQEQDQAVQGRRRFGFQRSLGVEPTTAQMPDAPSPYRPLTPVPNAGMRPDYGIPSQTHFPSNERQGGGGRNG